MKADLDGIREGLTLRYNDPNHAYYWRPGADAPLRRASGISTLAKMGQDSGGLEVLAKRQLIQGIVKQPRLLSMIDENTPKSAIDQVARDALIEAGAWDKANRGTAMHRMLEARLRGAIPAEVSEQDEGDLRRIDRTLERYGLTVHTDLVEQFVMYPHYGVAGRFDCVMVTPEGRVVMTDLKSGADLPGYMQAPAVQLALYARAPHVSTIVEDHGEGQYQINDWRSFPGELDNRIGYVLWIRPTDDVGTLLEVDIAHGWKAASHGLELTAWKRIHSRDIHREAVIPTPGDVGMIELATIERVGTVDGLRELWRSWSVAGTLSDGLRSAITARKVELAS